MGITKAGSNPINTFYTLAFEIFDKDIVRSNGVVMWLNLCIGNLMVFTDSGSNFILCTSKFSRYLFY